MNNNKASSTEFVLAGLTARIAHSVSRWTSRTKNQLRALLCIAAATAATPALGAAGPVLYLPFDEGAGSATVDAGTDGNDGTLTGGATWIGGQIGAAISFDGQNDFVQTGFAKHLPGWTVSAWVRSPAAPAAGVPNGPVHREDNFVISWDHPAEAFRGAMALSVGGDWRAASFGPLLPNTWHHLAGTYDGETLRSYRDGLLITANTEPSGPADDEASPLAIARQAGDGNFFPGDVDEVRVYDRALTPTEIVELVQLPPDTSPPVITGVFAVASGSTAIVTWATNEASDSVVSFGTDVGLGADAADAAPVTAHSVRLTGLLPQTVYFFRVSSQDASANVAVDDNGGALFSFTTSAAAANDLVLHYPLDAGAGSVALDASGNGRDGTLTNGPAWIAGLDGGGVAFDGSTSFIDTGFSDDLGAWTVAAWVRSPAAPSLGTSNGPIHREDAFVMSWDHPNADFRGAMALSVAGTWYSASFGAVAPNLWNHLAGTYDGETLRAYRNGVLISENHLPSGPPDSESAALLIGRNATVAHYFEGDADDVRIYSRALTGMELAELIAVPPDTEAPVISNVAAAPFGTTAVVSWTTDEPGDSRVTYGEDMNLGAVESDASRVVDHAVTLVGLAPSTTYFYKVTSTDGSANTVTDDNGGAMYSFTTSQSGGSGEPDADLDGMSDAWEGQWGFDPNDPADAGLDADGDGITNLEEYQAGTHPLIVFPGNAWQTRTPSQADLDPVILDEFVAAVGGDGVIVRNGYIVRSWGDIASSGGSWWSSSKPVLSTMLLFAVNEGLLGSSADPISDFVPGLLPMDQGITFGHLAQNTSGYMLAEGPGAAWSYNDYGINLFLKALYLGVFNEAGGLNPADAALTSARRLGALRFQDGNLYIPWQDGGWEIGASVRDFARIGMFWLHEGQWDGDQLLSRDMFRQYARPGIGQDFPLSSGVLDPNGDYLGVGSNGGAAGDLLDLMDGNGGRGIYGMHWWFNGQPVTRTTRLWPDVQGDAFGAFAGTRSSMVVFPGLDMVYAGRQTTIGLNEVTRNATFKRLMDAAGVPARPTGLIGMPQGLELVALDWDDSPDPGVAGYNVYRAQASGGPFTRRNAQPIVASDFIDTQTVQGESYYMVTAVTVDGIESACSNELPVVSNTSGLVVHYPLDEGGGVTAFDASGNGNDATLAQGAAWSAGPFGDALSFDGLGAELQTGFSSHLPVYTVSAWVRSPSAPLPGPPNGPVHREDNFVISWDHPAAEFRGAMALSVGGEWFAASFGSLAPDTWMHLAGTYDGETLRAYRDGVLITANPAPSGPADAEFAPLSVGKNATSPGYFEGDIDEVRIYNRVLSDAEIGELAR